MSIIFNHDDILTKNIPMSIIMGKSGIGKSRLLNQLASSKETDKIIYIEHGVSLSVIDYLSSISSDNIRPDSNAIKRYLQLMNFLQKPRRHPDNRSDLDFMICAEIYDMIGNLLFYNGARFALYRRECQNSIITFSEASVDSVPNSYIPMLILEALISNGSLNSSTTLIWDNPDAGLSPIGINRLSKILYLITHLGAQLFIASNSYEMIKNLEIRADSNSGICLYNLYEDETTPGKIDIEYASRIEDLPHQTLLDENNVLLDKIYHLE